MLIGRRFESLSLSVIIFGTFLKLTHYQVNGIGLAYVVVGNTGLPPVVFLHALGEDSSAWSTVVEALTPRYRTYAVDFRGQGGSERMLGGATESRRSVAVEPPRATGCSCRPRHPLPLSLQSRLPILLHPPYSDA